MMRGNKGGLGNLVRWVPFVPSILAFMTFALILVVVFTDLGQMATFLFVVGGASVITAVVFGFQATRRWRMVSVLLALMWLGTASIYFLQAVAK